MTLAIVAGLLRSLTEPSDFKGDPYGGALNQWGHYSLAAAMACIVYAVVRVPRADDR